MLAALGDRLRAAPRLLFVVGKGGVGKTTTASALALHLADSGQRTHLISTDPAHSIGDVFGLALPSEPTPSPCTPLLALEELDARGYARRWIDRAATPIAQLVERGTYLDADDARALTDLSLPGVDEIMGALRLVELAAGDAEHIVVDTAPTGHTLRLLDAGRLIADWAAALDAMAEKASAVGSALVGASIRPPGAELVDELRQQVRRFELEVLARAGFMVVHRHGSVVLAETERLLAELEARGLRVEALVCIGSAELPAGLRAPVVTVPAGRSPRGCVALRSLGDDVPGPAPPANAAGTPPGVAVGGPGAVDRLAALPRSLFLFAGKGGVGKTTCACAFALRLATERPTVLLSTDPAGSLDEVLGRAVPRDGVAIDGLEAIQVDAAAELERVEREYRESVAEAFRAVGLDTAAALDRQVVEALWGMAPPGVDELLALVRIVRALETGVTLVIDPAPTGHFLRLLEMPDIALEWAHALMRLILKYHLAGRLDVVARDLLQFARDLKDFLARLTDPERTAAVVVTLEEPVVAAETHRLLDRLAAAHVSVQAMLVNRAGAGPRRGIGEADAAPVAEQAGVRLPTIVAPVLADPPIAPEALRAFARRWEYVT